MKGRGRVKAKNETMPPSSRSNWTKPLLKGGQMMQMQVKRATGTRQNLQNSGSTVIGDHGAPLDRRIKVVLVGDGAVGKTSLVVSYSTNGFPGEYVPTAFDNYNVVVNVDGLPLNVQLCDTAGQDDFDPLRSLCYPETDVFLVCFSVVCPSSYHSVASRWVDEVRKYCPNAPIILVGTKSDLRSDVRLMLQLARYGQAPITTTQGHQLAQRLGAVSYVETSALTQHDLKEAFDQAIVSALSTRRGGAGFLSRRRKPLPLWRRWLCCWDRTSSNETFSIEKREGWHFEERSYKFFVQCQRGLHSEIDKQRSKFRIRGRSCLSRESGDSPYSSSFAGIDGQRIGSSPQSGCSPNHNGRTEWAG